MYETSYKIGGRAFHHEENSAVEQEYDHLRDLARQEASKRNSCFHKSREAYENGDGAAAKQLSEQGKSHGRKMEEHNQQASEFIFRENNAEGRVAADTIDLHGQFVEEAEDILEKRIRYARGHGQGHLHVIVGKGIHSADHVQKLKPRVEQICREEGLQYATEENTGRIYVNLTGGPAHMPAEGGYLHHAPYQHAPYQLQHQEQHQHQHHYQPSAEYKQEFPSLPHQQPQEPQPGPVREPPEGEPQPQQPQESEKPKEQPVPKLLRKLEKACCVVM